MPLLHKTAALAALASASTVLGWTLETQPWMSDPYELDFDTAFTYSHYPKVEGASRQLKHPSNDRLLAMDLKLTASQNFDVQLEAEFADTPRQKWGWRSGAAQARYRWLNDINGDPFSLVTGADVRIVSQHSLRDVSCPYHSNFNAELSTAAGKEWSKDSNWTMHLWGTLKAGIANHGAPWLLSELVWRRNWADTHRFTLFAEGYFGFGGREHVNVDHFHGWSHFHHQSIDLGTGYGYHFHTWGTLSLTYAYRVYARAFPERINFVMLRYCLPFSPFY